MSEINLSILDDTILTYTWRTSDAPAGAAPVSFSPNGTNDAKNCMATVGAAGTYRFEVRIRDITGVNGVRSTRTTVVPQILTSIDLSPANVTLAPGATQQFTAVAKDQFGNPMAPQPDFSWSCGPGIINSRGFYTAPEFSRTSGVSVAAGSISASVDVAIMAIQPNGMSFDAASGQFTIQTDLFSNTILIRPDPFDATQLNVTISGVDGSGKLVLSQAKSFPITQVKSILLNAKDAFNVTFNNNTAIPSTAYAGKGANGFYGGSGNDAFYGGPGSNTFFGYGGKNVLAGGTGNNYLYGGSPNDALIKGPGPGLNFLIPKT